MQCLQTADTAANQNNGQSSVQITYRGVYESSWRLVVVAYLTDDNPVFFTGLSAGVPVPLGRRRLMRETTLSDYP